MVQEILKLQLGNLEHYGID